jgi:dienelactone hydrolase
MQRSWPRRVHQRALKVAPRILQFAVVVICMGLNIASYAQSSPKGFEVVEFPSAHADGTMLRGYLSQAPNPSGQVPAKQALVLALHGCGGLWSARGDLDKRYRDYQHWFNQRGIHFLALDSFSPRGKASGICTEALAKRNLHPADRRLDVQGALRWIKQQPWVDQERLLLLGWSHGASTLLSSIDRGGIVAVSDWPPDLGDFKAAVAFYPGCTPASQTSQYRLKLPLLLMIGEDDNWTPARACQVFYDQQARHLQAAGLDPARLQLKLYPGAHHGFDSTSPVRHRADVPNGVNRRQGVMSGGHPASREDALKTLDAFVKQFL